MYDLRKCDTSKLSTVVRHPIKKILVQNRLNINWPGVTFSSGHVEYAESFTNSVI
ncbi:MAG: hypothetical protein ACLRW8_09120 [Clostridium cadaveris]